MRKITTILTMYLFYISQIQLAFADDVELYQSGDVGIRPNVTFLVDTSGSMNNKVTLEGSFYDHTEKYPGPFRNDRLYYYEFNETGSDIFDIKAIQNDLLDNTIHPDSFKCQTEVNNLEQRGYAVSKFLQWDPSINFEVYYAFKGWKPFHGVWRRLRTTDDPSRYVDCQPDINSNSGLAQDDYQYMSHDMNGEPYTSDKGKAVPKLLPAHIFRPASPAFAGRGWWGLLDIDKIGSTNTVYTGNYLNYDFATQNNITRVPRLYYLGQIVSDSVAQYPGLNVSLARFDGRVLGNFNINFDWDFSTPLIQYEQPEGGMIAIESKYSEGNALEFENTIKSWDAWGETPLTESYSESVRYIKGENVNYGDHTRVFATRDGFLGIGGKYHDYPSVAGSRIGGASGSQYQTPMTESCQPNHVIMLTDGYPTNDEDANSYIRNLISDVDFPVFPDGHILKNRLSKSCGGDGGCIEELAYYLANEDQFDDSQYKGTQTIVTHTIAGFVSDADRALGAATLMEAVAEAGQGIYKDAKSSDDVRDALNSIFASIQANSVSFTAPSVPVNAFNNLEISDDLYYSLFKPSKNLTWEGNVKRYKLAEMAGNYEIVDSEGNLATDTENAYFAEGTRSFWTSKETYPNGDGAEVSEGGILAHLPAERKVFTSYGGKLVPLDTNSASKQQLGIESKDNAYHEALVKWGSGRDGFDSNNDGSTDDPIKIMQDPLHSEPAIVTYFKDEENNKIDRTMFVGSNGGYLHAFDIDNHTPGEHFAFIPKELLANLEQYYSGGGLLATKAYGVDGMVTHWHKDYSDPDAKTNGNRIVDPGESVYLFFGLRRGGQSYYALDVTDRTAPKLLWEKHGNYPADFPNRPAMSPGYENLGQSWSRLEPGLIKWQGKPKTVLFASGGYDPIEDGNLAEGTHRTGPLSRIEHSMGTTLYIIDAKTGEVLWDAKKHSNMSSQLTSSFPASPAPVDIDGDSFADAIFASDVGGRIWRFDLDNDAKSSDSLAKGRIIADLNSGSGIGNRRFYNEVDVIGRPDREQILLSIGSGNRSHPATSSTAAHNHQFIIHDTLVSPEKTPAPVTLSDLKEFPEYSDKGWFFSLSNPGEKVLARSNTFQSKLMFSTFTPKTAQTNNCDAEPGIGRTYVLDIDKPYTTPYNPENPNDIKYDEYILRSGGIPPMPIPVIPKKQDKKACDSDGNCKDLEITPPVLEDILVGTETLLKKNGGSGVLGEGEFDPIEHQYWYER